MIGISTASIADSSRTMKHVRSFKSAKFNGTSDGLQLTDSNDLSPTRSGGVDMPFSISTWINVQQTGSYKAGIFSKGSSLNSKEYKLFVHNGSLMFDIVDNSDNVYRRVTAKDDVLSTPNNTWYHVVATYDGSELSTGLTLYVNGLDVFLDTGSGGSYVGMENTDSRVAIGYRIDDSNYDFKGFMTDIMFWKDYEINSAEVQALYNNGEFSVDPTVDQGVYDGANYLKVWFKCDNIVEPEGGGANYITDSSGNNNHGFLVGDLLLDTSIPTSNNIDNEYE